MKKLNDTLCHNCQKRVPTKKLLLTYSSFKTKEIKICHWKKCKKIPPEELLLAAIFNCPPPTFKETV